MSVTEKMCFNPLRPLRVLKPLNYLSPLIRFFKPLNPLNRYWQIYILWLLVSISTDLLYKYFFAYVVTHRHARTAWRQETQDRRRETDRRSETDRRRETVDIKQET